MRSKFTVRNSALPVQLNDWKRENYCNAANPTRGLRWFSASAIAARAKGGSVRVLPIGARRGEQHSFPDQPIVDRAANAGCEPNPGIVILCCERSQHKKCGVPRTAIPPRGERNGHSRMLQHCADYSLAQCCTGVVQYNGSSVRQLTDLKIVCCQRCFIADVNRLLQFGLKGVLEGTFPKSPTPHSNSGGRWIASISSVS